MRTQRTAARACKRAGGTSRARNSDTDAAARKSASRSTPRRGVGASASAEGACAHASASTTHRLSVGGTAEYSACEGRSRVQVLGEARDPAGARRPLERTSRPPCAPQAPAQRSSAQPIGNPMRASHLGRRPRFVRRTLRGLQPEATKRRVGEGPERIHLEVLLSQRNERGARRVRAGG